jgi:cytochrome c553
MRNSVALAVTIALGCASGAVHAQGANAGRALAAGCSNCHGTDGRSPTAVPKLAGGDKARFVALMKEFREGKRPATIMHQLAKGYTDQQIELIGEYFAAQKP